MYITQRLAQTLAFPVNLLGVRGRIGQRGSLMVQSCQFPGDVLSVIIIRVQYPSGDDVDVRTYLLLAE